MTRYPDNGSPAYEYHCTACGALLPDFQGLFWFVRKRTTGEGTAEIPYCPECGAEAIRARRGVPER